MLRDINVNTIHL